MTLSAAELVLVNELAVYEYDITDAGRIRYSASSGFHDDCVDALALTAEEPALSASAPSGTGTW